MSEVLRGQSISGFPSDSIQLTEALKENSAFLQTMADFNEDTEAVKELTYHLGQERLLGRTVLITGGRIQVPAFDSNEGKYVLVPHQETEGEYLGIMWRRYESEVFPGMVENQLVHTLYTGGQYTYEDAEGNEIIHTPRTFITAADSSIQLQGQQDRHDYRRLAQDGFSLKLDQIAFDESQDYNEKLSVAAKMFGEISDNASQQHTELMYQRLSYLNHLGVFNDLLCDTDYVFHRDGENMKVIFLSPGKSSAAPVLMVGFDSILQRDEDNSFKASAEKYLCLELDHPQLGLVSAPIIPGRTRLVSAK